MNIQPEPMTQEHHLAPSRPCAPVHERVPQLSPLQTFGLVPNLLKTLGTAQFRSLQSIQFNLLTT